MKPPSFVTALLFIISLGLHAADPPPQDTPYAVTERGAHHNIWERTTYEITPSGAVVSHVHRYQEMATGLNHAQNGQWIGSTEEIDPLLAGGASATNGQHQVFFPSDIYQGIVELITPDGLHLQSRPVGISYFDGSNSVLIAELTNSIGQITGNQVIYTNAFTDFKADLVCIYRKSGLECDLVFREQPPGPDAYGLNPAITRLQLLTEFFNTSAPVEESVDLINGLNDTTLLFGTMKMVRGKAFLVDGQNQNSVGIPVNKSWQQMESRNFLVEEIPYLSLAPDLENLPLHVAGIGTGKHKTYALRQPSLHRILPAPRTAQKQSRPLKVARGSSRQKGLVLDYVLATSATDFTFQGDTTYYVTDTVNLSGTTTVEGGTVIKFTNQPNAKLSMGTLVCLTAPYRPAIFTSKDDDSIGETISYSTGIPTNYNGGAYVYSTTANTYKYLRMSFAGIGIQADSAEADVWHSQFVQCGTAIFSSTTPENVTLHDLLFSLCCVAVSNGVVTAENITADQIITLSSVSGPNLTNSILTAVTNIGSSPVLDHCTTNSSGAGIYQKVGAANYYLAADSTNRNAGTTNINSTLLADLGKRTTYPPLIYSNFTLSADLTLGPQAQRDTDTPDLGYHYDPIDFAVDEFAATNGVTLTLSGGVALAVFGDYGIILNQANIVSEGRPLAMNYLVRYQAVQEQPQAWGAVTEDESLVLFEDSDSDFTGIEGRLRFTHVSVPSSPSGLEKLFESTSYTSFPLHLTDCYLAGGSIYHFDSYGGSYTYPLAVTNNVFERVALTLDDADGAATFFARNNLFWNGSYSFNFPGGNSWAVYDNVFDNCTLTLAGDFLNGTNGYVNCGPLSGSSGGDVQITNFVYDTGPLGRFYQDSTNFVDKGSRSAAAAGLYHYTTQTNQVKEANSTVDLGFHYVALTNGVPIDTDGDGTPDYLEDANGNGLVDSGETDWQSAADLGLKVWIIRPRNNSTIP